MIGFKKKKKKKKNRIHSTSFAFAALAALLAAHLTRTALAASAPPGVRSAKLGGKDRVLCGAKLENYA